MLMLVFKTMTAMKLTREDNIPSEIIEGLYLGSVGAAYSNESLQKHGITHILTCAANLKPRFPDVQ
jgi:protein phosphatase slingshot